MTSKHRKARVTRLEDGLPPLVRVIWHDAAYNTGACYDPPDNSGGIILSSIGHLFREDDSFLYLSGDYNELGDARHGQDIPKVNVIEVYALGTTRRRKL